MTSRRSWEGPRGYKHSPVNRQKSTQQNDWKPLGSGRLFLEAEKWQSNGNGRFSWNSGSCTKTALFRPSRQKQNKIGFLSGKLPIIPDCCDSLVIHTRLSWIARENSFSKCSSGYRACLGIMHPWEELSHAVFLFPEAFSVSAGWEGGSTRVTPGHGQGPDRWGCEQPRCATHTPGRLGGVLPAALCLNEDSSKKNHKNPLY